MPRSEQQIRQNIAKNIAFYRKQNNDTQAELAERLNYSDKSVSKWERGDGTPDIVVLSQLAELYDITVDDLLREAPVPPKVRKRLSHVLLLLIGIGLVWLVTTAVFFSLEVANIDKAWLSFLYAVPASGIVMTVFSAIWFRRLLQCIGVSVIVWGIAVSLQVSLLVFASYNISVIYVVAAVFQALTILWFFYLKNRARAKQLEAASKQQQSRT